MSKLILVAIAVQVVLWQRAASCPPAYSTTPNSDSTGAVFEAAKIRTTTTTSTASTTSSITTSTTASTTTTSTGPTNCGVNKYNNVPQTGAAIVGGRLAAVGEFPWQARIVANGSLCGGVLFHPNWVLTAAHCCPSATGTAQSQYPITVSLGSINLYGPFEYEQNSVSYIRKSQYSTITFDSDYCLVSLPTRVTYSDNVRPICLASSAASSVECQLNDYATVSGWGLNNTNSSLGSVQSVLKTNTVPITSQSTCSAYFYGLTITSNMICAGGVYGQGTCNGDSGGPLACIKNNNQYTLSGLTSFRRSDGCALNGPAVYSRISSVYSWINSIAPVV